MRAGRAVRAIDIPPSQGYGKRLNALVWWIKPLRVQTGIHKQMPTAFFAARHAQTK